MAELTELTELMEIFAGGRFPREVGRKKSSGFTRNRYVRSAEELAEFALKNPVDSFVSVYSFDGVFEEGKMWDRDKAIVDRLFVDLDCEDLRVALEETKMFVSALEKEGVRPIVVFSGARGFHVHVPFEPVRIRVPTSLKKLGAEVVERYGLTHADASVFERARLCRLPATANSKTGLKAVTISPEKLTRLDLDGLLKIAKGGELDVCEPQPSDWHLRLREIDEEVAKAVEEARKNALSGLVAGAGAGAVTVAAAGAGGFSASTNTEFHPLFRKRRIAEYATALVLHGKLTRDPEIAAIHARSKWFSQHRTAGALEHIARVYFILLLLEEGCTDEQIHGIFSFAEDYDPDVTQYYIDYNRRRVHRSNTSHTNLGDCERRERVERWKGWKGCNYGAPRNGLRTPNRPQSPVR